MLDVDVGGVPSLTNTQSQYWFKSAWMEDSLKYCSLPGDATRHAAAAEAGLALEGWTSSRPGWDTGDYLQH